jgi:hypothetical protein
MRIELSTAVTNLLLIELYSINIRDMDFIYIVKRIVTTAIKVL